jgi:hypothetical protein
LCVRLSGRYNALDLAVGKVVRPGTPRDPDGAKTEEIRMCIKNNLPNIIVIREIILHKWLNYLPKYDIVWEITEGRWR